MCSLGCKFIIYSLGVSVYFRKWRQIIRANWASVLPLWKTKQIFSSVLGLQKDNYNPVEVTLVLKKAFCNFTRGSQLSHDNSVIMHSEKPAYNTQVFGRGQNNKIKN